MQQVGGMTTVDEEDLHTLDYSRNVLPLGVRLRKKDDEGPYLALDAMDWALLYSLLTSKITLSDGREVCAVQESNNLQLLAKFAKGAFDWYSKTGTVSRAPSPVDAWSIK